MEMSGIQTVVFLGGIGLFTLLAAVSDYRERKIPNRLNVAAFVAGLVYQVSFAGLAGLGDGLCGFGVGFGILLVLWLIGGGVAGDVKMFGALGTWLGLTSTIYVLVLSTFFVFVVTVTAAIRSMVKHGYSKTVRDHTAKGRSQLTPKQRRKRRTVPFAVPVALATWCFGTFIVIQTLTTPNSTETDPPLGTIGSVSATDAT